MNEIIKKEIKELYNSFDESNYYYEKYYILTVLSYLMKIIPSDYEISDMFDMICFKIGLSSDDYRKYLSTRQDEIFAFMEKNKLFFNESIPKITKKEKFPYNYLPPLREENISYIIEEFLKSIDSGIFKFYQKMIDEGRIIYSIENNIAMTSLYDSKTIVFVEDLKTLQDIMILLHELGHAYYMYVNNCRVIERADIVNEIKDEIPAKIMEVKFIKFVSDWIINYGLILQNKFNEIMYQCDDTRYNYESMKYLIASNIALSLGNKYFNLTRFFKHIHRNDVFDLINKNNKEKILGKVLRK